MVWALLADAVFSVDIQTTKTHQTLLITHVQQKHLPSPTKPTQLVTKGLLICPPPVSQRHRKPFWPVGLTLQLSPGALQGKPTSKQ